LNADDVEELYEALREEQAREREDASSQL